MQQALDRWSVAPDQLVCEITETGFLRQPEKALDTLTRLRKLGVGLSLDDFGTGHSSLAYLRDLPIQEIKLDRLFVSQMSRSGRDEQIVAHVISLAHALGLTVVAEGVEDFVTAERLRVLGCDLLQGFCFTKPLPPPDLVAWVGTLGEPAPDVSGTYGKLAEARVGIEPGNVAPSRRRRQAGG